MKCIYFQSERELIYFCELIFRKTGMIQAEWKRTKYWGSELKLITDDMSADTMVTCFRDLYLHMRLDNVVRNKLETVYYYTDDAEINHIANLVKNIVMEDCAAYDLNNRMMQLFYHYIADAGIVHYDAMITFSSKEMTEPLEEITGFGIDEWKLEEAHHFFIDSVRYFLKRRTPVVDTLHIVQGETFLFYKQNGQQYSMLELRTAMLNTPLSVIGLDENEWNLAPVVALCPKKISIYGENLSEAKTITLFNVFEERVHFFSSHEFPFYYSK